MIQWRFPSNNYGETKGINDSGVAMFRGTPLKSLAREICQNSLDAAQAKTVIVDFDLFYMPTKNIPGADSLKDAFKRSLDFWKSTKGGSTREFFENAIKVMDKATCPILRISDHNTTGLLGSRELINTDWVNLTKSAGASDKLGTAGGSFGIGKYAPFACSDFSTVFYSTYDIKKECACQGVSRLVTFMDSEGETTQGTGYYGNEKNTPVYEQLNLQQGYNRSDDDYGTDIFITGYKYDNGEWQSSIIVSILDSFLGAIWNEKLVVRVGKVELSKATLPNTIEEYKNSLLDNTAYYYETLISPDTKWIEHSFAGLGEVKYGVLLGNPDAPRKVAMYRKTGMKIKNKGFSSSVPFSAVLFIDGEKLNQRLRAMENPEHNEWQPDRVIANPAAARALLKMLYGFLRDKIQELAFDGNGDEIDAAGAGAYLPDEDPDSPQQAKDEVISNKVLDIDKKIKTPPKSKPTPEEPDKSEVDEGEIQDESGDGVQRVTGGDLVGWVDGDGGHMTNVGNGTKLTFTEVETPGVGSKIEKSIKKSIVLKKFVPICINRDKGVYVLVVETNETYQNCYMDIFLSAETRGYEAPIIAAEYVMGNQIKIKGNILQNLKFEKDVPARIKLTIDYSNLCSMEVKAYAIEK